VPGEVGRQEGRTARQAPQLALDVDVETIFETRPGPESARDQRIGLLARHIDTLEPKGSLVSLAEFKGRIDTYPHQVNAALRVLTKMGGRAILADEVGLGKTIEAGIVLRELLMRGLVESVLVLTPASLVTQWQAELSEKFGEDFVTHEDSEFQGYHAHDKIIASIDTAKLEENARQILGREWDLLIVDEAHYLKNKSTLRYQLASQLEAKYFLALTATPIQNNLRELFNLIHLVRPGLLGSARTFDNRYLADNEGRQLRNTSELQEKLQEVIIRNRRKDTGLTWPERVVKTNAVQGDAKEYRLHDMINDYVSEQFESKGFQLSLLLLQREVASSPGALVQTLERMQRSGEAGGTEFDKLYDLASKLRKSSKAELLLGILERMKDPRVIVYTQFRKTQELLTGRLKRLGINAVPFHGQLTPGRKRNAIQRFRDEGGVLVATDAGSEGLNLQFAHVLVNYDLPWNPMRVEQRIGRVHRLGQKEDVLIINLALKDTVEDYVLKVLYDKIRLFEVAIGEMDLILSDLESGESLEAQIFEILSKSRSKSARRRNLSKLQETITKGVAKAEDVKAFDDNVFNQFELGTQEGA
jgi:SNF2 family DNA or RNA helicase